MENGNPGRKDQESLDGRGQTANAGGDGSQSLDEYVDSNRYHESRADFEGNEHAR